MRDREEFEKWLSEFLEIDHGILKRCRAADNEGLAGYEGLEQEGCSDDADDMATLALQSWQEARAQQAGSGEAVHQWREIGETDWMDCSKEWKEKCDESPEHDTRTLYTHPSALVPEDVIAAARGYLLSDGPYDWSSVDRAHAVKVLANRGLLTTPTPATTPQPADNWIKCSERLPTEADEDCRGQVWSAYRDPVTKAKSGPHLQSVSMVLLCATDSPEALYWMPTGLKRPNPPAEGAE